MAILSVASRFTCAGRRDSSADSHPPARRASRSAGAAPVRLPKRARPGSRLRPARRLFENEDAAGQIENGLFFGGLNPVGVAVAQVRKAALQKGPQLAQASALQAARFQILVENGLLGLTEHTPSATRGPLSERIGQNAAGVIEGCGYQARAQARAWGRADRRRVRQAGGLCGRVCQSALRKARDGVINRSQETHRRTEMAAERWAWRIASAQAAVVSTSAPVLPERGSPVMQSASVAVGDRVIGCLQTRSDGKGRPSSSRTLGIETAGLPLNGLSRGRRKGRRLMRGIRSEGGREGKASGNEECRIEGGGGKAGQGRGWAAVRWSCG